MAPTPFLATKSGKTFAVFLLMCIVGAVVFGAFHYKSHVDSFVSTKSTDSVRTLRLIEAFVANYSEVRSRQFGNDAPVPSSFRAHSIDRFNAAEDMLDTRLSWVGVPGREMRMAAPDDMTAAILGKAAETNDARPQSHWHSVGDEPFFRTIYPSVATHESCVDCHNTQLKGRPPWRLNDVMGALVFDVSAEAYLAHAWRETIFFSMAVLGGCMSVGFVVFWLQYQRRNADINATLLSERERLAIEAKESAEAANRAKSEFLALMSHELRTPLNAINGFSEMIAEEVLGPVDARYRGYAQDIHRSGNHLLTVIGDILDVAKAESGRLQLHEDRVDLDQIIEPCIRTVAVRAHDAGIELMQNVRAGVNLVGDVTKLRQIALNLLSNAVKFTARGGRISVTGDLTTDGRIKIEVADNGIGIAPEDIPRVIKPFEQVEPQYQRRREGTGLGLPLAKLLAELHGGSLEIESQLGRGTRVSVFLPAQRLLDEAAALVGPAPQLA